ncbi:MAG: chorismate-binding protein [Victivallaceae bacterium]|nr:chorismate-binding protein [Victivallaceae bacterium]
MKKEEFLQLAAEYDLIPVHREFIADVETPVSVLARLDGSAELFLLESVESSERFGRYSFIGLNPRGVFTVEHGRPFFRDRSGKRELPAPDGAISALRGVVGGLRTYSPPELPPLFGGAVGFMGYETVNQFERLPEPKGMTEQPESAFMLTDEMIIFDNQRHRMTVSVCVRPAEHASTAAAYDFAQKRIAAIRALLLESPAAFERVPDGAACEFTPQTSREDYMAKVELAREYIRRGEVIQLVLSQKFTAPLGVPAVALYRALRLINPSPYTFFMKLDGTVLIGSSPETLCSLSGRAAVLRPIAGTRRREADPDADRRMADELLGDEKERAEHLMLVDLGRNDLGRIAIPGSVQVKDFMTVERYSHVMHLVSTIEALPRPGIDAFDLLRAAFPAGTLSGAPKVRAMELIHELEDAPRNAYGGAAGYFSYSGNMDLAITIRTFAIRNNLITVQAGAGIVCDSDPASEYAECRNKAAALFKAVKLAAAGLELDKEE